MLPRKNIQYVSRHPWVTLLHGAYSFPSTLGACVSQTNDRKMQRSAKKVPAPPWRPAGALRCESRAPRSRPALAPGERAGGGRRRTISKGDTTQTIPFFLSPWALKPAAGRAGAVSREGGAGPGPSRHAGHAPASRGRGPGYLFSPESWACAGMLENGFSLQYIAIRTARVLVRARERSGIHQRRAQRSARKSGQACRFEPGQGKGKSWAAPCGEAAHGRQAR